MNAEAVGKNVVKERNAASRVDPGERNAPTVGFVPFDDERRPFARGGDVASPPRVGAFDVAAEGPRGEVERESVGLRRVERQLDAEETGFGEGTDDVIEHVVRGRGPEQKRNGKRIRRTGLKKVLDNAKKTAYNSLPLANDDASSDVFRESKKGDDEKFSKSLLTKRNQPCMISILHFTKCSAL